MFAGWVSPRATWRARLKQPDVLLLVAIWSASVWSLCIHYDRLPGINGDEPKGAVMAERLSSGFNVKTSNGRLMSPPFLLASAIFQTIGPHTVFALRFVAVSAGLAIIALVPFLFRRMVGRGAAIGGAALVASAPMLLAYGRIGWDICHTALFALLALYFAWTERWWATWLFFLLALMAHPTNVFLGPLLFIPQIWWLLDRANRKPLRISLVLALDLAGCAATYFLSLGQGGGVGSANLSPMDFSRDLFRYLDGATAFEYFTTTPTARWMNIGDGVSMVFGAMASVGLGILAREGGRERRFILGFAAMLVAVYVIGGDAVLSAGLSRWGVSLVVPCFFFAGLGLNRFSGLVGWKRPWLALAAACMLLVAFFFGFVRAADVDGASAVAPYWTGTEEPKVAAYHRGEAVLHDGGRFHVEDWWNYWPVRYLDGAHKPERIEWHKRGVDAAVLQKQILAGDVAIGFAGGPLDKSLAPFAGTLERIVWHAPSGKETVAMWEAKGSQ